MIIIPDSIKDVVALSRTATGKISFRRYMKVRTDEIKTFLDVHDMTISQLAYLVDNDLDDIPVCPVCGEKVKSYEKGIIFCSRKCASSSEEKKSKTKQTNLVKYGTEYVFQADEIKNKIKDSVVKKYGVDHISQSEIIKDKKKETSLEHYGTDSPLKCEDVRKRISETNKELYGNSVYLKTEDFIKKSNDTLLKRYGSICLRDIKEVKDRRKQTYIERYGVSSPLKHKAFLEKHHTTKRRNYFDSFSKMLLKTKNISPLFGKEEYSKFCTPYRYHCMSCGCDFDSEASRIQFISCPNCSKTSTSIEENEIYEFVRSIYHGNVIKNDRKQIFPLELDILIPEKHVAIEYDGLYWHSERYKSSLYHLDKTEKCASCGMRLIHVFENEWLERKDIVKSIIASSLGIYEERIYARKCSVEHIASSTYKEFLNENHVQGYVNSSVRLGLFYKNDLVAVIGFGKSRFKNGEMELHRFCSKINTQVVGGFSKLIKHSGISSFVSYVDRSKFDGYGYHNNDFSFVCYTRPSYVYVRQANVLSRYDCQKHKLKKFLESYDEALSEHENMVNNNYFRLYDCGTIKLQYTNKSED